MCTVRLISPSFYTNTADLLRLIAETTADLIVLPAYPDIPNDPTTSYAFAYPSVKALQAVLKKGQTLFCQQPRKQADKSPKNLLITRKTSLSLGRVCSSDEVAEHTDKYMQRLCQRRLVSIQQHNIVFVFGDELFGLDSATQALIQADLVVLPQAIRPTSWVKLGRALKTLSDYNSVAYVTCNNGSNPKTLSKSKTSIKLYNHGEENTDAVQWIADKHTFCLDIPLAD